MKLSILIAGLVTRSNVSCDLKIELAKQASRFPWQVEILALEDAMLRPTGRKRNALLDIAEGEYTAFVDDDDRVSRDYVESLMETIENNPGVDCISFLIDYSRDGKHEFIARYDPAQPWPHDYGLPTRTYTGSHTMCYRRKAIEGIRFDDKWWGEDVPFTRKAVENIKSHVRIEKILYCYKFSSGWKEHQFMEQARRERESVLESR